MNHALEGRGIERVESMVQKDGRANNGGSEVASPNVVRCDAKPQEHGCSEHAPAKDAEQQDEA